MPNVSVYDTEKNATVSIPADQVEAGVKAGRYVKTGESVVRQNANGTDVSRSVEDVPALDLGGAQYGTGYQDAAAARQAATQEALTSWDRKASVFAEGILDAATFGVLRSHDEADMAAREANPGSAFAGNVVGAVAGMGTSVGKGLVKGGQFAGKSFAKALIKEGEGRLAKAGARAIEEAATGAVITGTMATTHQLGDAIIENKPLSAAAWAHEVGFGTLLAGGIGAAAGALSRGGATRAAVKGQGGLLDSASADSAAVHAAVEDTVGTYGQHLEALANKHGIMTAIDQETGLLSRGAMAERGAALKEAGKAYERLKSIKLDKALDNEAKFAEWQAAHDDFYAKFQAVDDKMNITPGEADAYSAARQADIGNTPGMAPGMRPRKMGENPVQRSPGAPQEDSFNVNTMDVRLLNNGIKGDIQMAGQQAEAEMAGQLGPGDKYKQIYGEDWQPSVGDDIRDVAERKVAGIESTPARAIIRQGADEATGVIKAVTPDLQAEGVQLGRQAVKQGAGEAIGVLNAVKPIETQEGAGEAFQRFMTKQTNKVEPQWGYDGVWKPELVGVKDRQMGKLADRYRATDVMDTQPGEAVIDSVHTRRTALSFEAQAEQTHLERLASMRENLVANRWERGPTAPSMAAQENAAVDNAKASEARQAADSAEKANTPRKTEVSTAAQENAALDKAASKEPIPELGDKPQQPLRKPEKSVIRWMEDWHAESQQMGPRLSPFQKASEKAREAIEAINSKHGQRLDAAGGLNPQELFGLPRSTTALGERMQQLFTLRQAGKMVASASRGGKVPAAASRSASTWLQRNLAGQIGAKLMGGIVGGALGGPIGFAIGASMMAGGAGSIGRVAGAAGRLTAKIGEATERLLSGKVGKALAPSVTNQAFAYDSDGPIKNLPDRIEKINALAANPDAVRQKVMESFGDLAYISPELAQAAADHAINKLQMLKMRMPVFMWDSLGRPMQLSENKARVFEEYEQAAHDLDVILDSMKAGRLTRCQADALRECWPEVHSEIIKPLLTQKDKYAKLNDVGKRQIEMVLGGPVFSNPGDVIRHQQMWQQANQQAPAQQLAGQGKVQALNISETPAQSSMAPGNQ